LEAKEITVLFLLMEFAPVNTTGNFRSLKFVKYLREFGIEPVIVTFIEEEGASYFNTKIDKGLLKDIPEGTKIYRVHCEDGHKYYGSLLRSFFTIYFSIKDTFAKRWRKFLLPELSKIVQEHRPSLIFTSLPPFSSGGLAREVAGKFHLPLVVDMRDLYSQWGNTPYGSWLHYWLTLKEEKRIFKAAQSILCVTPQLIRTFKKTHPEINPLKFHFTPNGFDLEQDRISDFLFHPNKQRIVIGYVGSFYYDPKARDQILKPWWKMRGHKMLMYAPTKEDWLYRSPYFFLQTIALLFERNPNLKSLIKIEFIGREPEWLKPMVVKFNLQAQVTIHGFVDHEKSKTLQSGFDLLLTTSEKVMDEEHYSLPSKIFDYVGQSKPILGFVTEGIQKEFILSSGIGIICDPDNPNESASKINSLIANGMKFIVNNDYLNEFKRKNITGKVASIIRKNVLKS
jgi:Glycosyltransferase Family 4/Glycosyl transferases group 1